MIAPTKAEKVTYLKFIFYHLWHGKTEAVLDYLKTVVKTKNPEKLAELIGYIEVTVHRGLQTTHLKWDNSTSEAPASPPA